MGDETMAPADIFRRLIRRAGPISLAHFMAESNARYYASKDPLGSDGDFVTAPEISQMFGELIGLWFADLWIRAGRPKPVHYLELGPGRGTLARDALRTMKRYELDPQVHFVEASPPLRKLQAEAVPEAQFHADLASVPMDGALLVLANEFLDALPVRQFLRSAEGWRERMVGLDGDTFVYLTGTMPVDAAVPPDWRSARQGAIVETSPAAAAVVSEIADRLADQGGCALMMRTAHRGEVATARDRLIADDQMGTLFKVMGLGAPGWPSGVGFEDT